MDAFQIEINAIDSESLQYAFFTLMQLCKIYAQSNIPALRVSLVIFISSLFFGET